MWHVVQILTPTIYFFCSETHSIEPPYVPSDTCIPLSLCFFSQTLTQFVSPEHLSVCGSWHSCHGTLLWYWHTLSHLDFFSHEWYWHTQPHWSHLHLDTDTSALSENLLFSDTHTLYVSDIYLWVLTPSLLRPFSQPITIILPFRYWHPLSQRGYFRICRYLHTHPVTYSTSLHSRKYYYYYYTIETLLCSVQILNFQSKHYASGYWHTISRWSCRIPCSDTDAIEFHTSTPS